MSKVKKRAKNPDGDNRSFRRNWTDEEVDKVLDYLRHVIRNDKEIEKPNARAFYGEMLKEIPLPNCNSISVINKVRGIKKCYDEAVKWLEESSQDVQDDTAVREYVLNLCKNFDVLDEIFSNRISNNVSYKDRDTIALDVVKTETDVSASVFDCSTYDVTVDTVNGDSLSSPMSPQSSVPMSLASTTTMSSWSSDKSKRRKSPSEYDIPIPCKRQEIQITDSDVQRANIEQKRLELEREFKERQLNLEERKLELEQEFKREELQFMKEKYNRDKEVELEKFKIEQDVKLQIELAKINSKNGSCY